MKESIKMYRSMRDAKKRVASQNPEYWTNASEQMYRHCKSHMISRMAFWVVVACGVAALVYLFG